MIHDIENATKLRKWAERLHETSQREHTGGVVMMTTEEASEFSSRLFSLLNVKEAIPS